MFVKENPDKKTKKTKKQKTNNHEFVLRDFSLVIFENFEIALVLLRQFQSFQRCARAIILNCPPKHVITSSSITMQMLALFHYRTYRGVNGLMRLGNCLCRYIQITT